MVGVDATQGLMEGNDEARFHAVEEAPQGTRLRLTERPRTRVVSPGLPNPLVSPVAVQVHSVGILPSVGSETVGVYRGNDPYPDAPNSGSGLDGFDQPNACGFIAVNVPEYDCRYVGVSAAKPISE